MYLSRVEIDLENRQKISDLSHIGAYHAWVEDSFPKENAKEGRPRKLWRVDQVNGKRYLLVLSPNKPDPEKLEKYGVSGSSQVLDYGSFLDSLEEGMKGKFRVVLNPVKSIPQLGKKRGRLVPLSKDEHQLDFIQSRAEKNGFEIDQPSLRIVEKGQVDLQKKGQRLVSLKRTVYEGNLVITDLDKFKVLLTQGFGKKKAYGFGLMTIIPYK